MLLEYLEPLDGGGGLEFGEDPRSVTIILRPSKQRPNQISHLAWRQLLRREAGETPNQGRRARQPIVARGGPCDDRLSQKAMMPTVMIKDRLQPSMTPILQRADQRCLPIIRDEDVGRR